MAKYTRVLAWQGMHELGVTMIADVEKVKSAGVSTEITRIVPEAVQQPVEIPCSLPVSYHWQNTHTLAKLRANSSGAH
jgi:hypothetical protein